MTTCEEATIGLASGWPTTEMPYSTSVPMTRLTDMAPAYGQQRWPYVGEVGWWTERVVPRCADRALSTGSVMKLRQRTCEGLSGRVLEIGFGSGLNVEKYSAAVTGVDAVEPSDLGWSLSAERRSSSPVPVERVGLDGQRLEAADASYDAALSTFTLCTIPDAAAAVAEVRRVLRPGGVFHVLEHGLSPDPGVAAWQRRLNGLQGRLAGGCHLDRDAAALVRDAGFEVEVLTRQYLPGPRLARPFGWVTALRARAPVTADPADHSDRALAAAEALGLAHEVTRHGPVRSLEEAAAARGVAPHQLVKTMVVRVAEDEHVFVLVPGDREIAWAKLRALLGVNRLTMASADAAYDVTGYVRGTITPLGSLTALPVVADASISGRISLGGGAPGVALTVDAAALVAALGATVADVT